MRKRFEQPNLIFKQIRDVAFSLKTRDELAPVLRALQHVFITIDLNEKIFDLLEEKIVNSKMKTGRKGMDLWHILVLGVVRHTLNCNWDRLLHYANYDRLVREVMGVECTNFSPELVDFQYQTILDNVRLIDEDLLGKINEIVITEGLQIIKKKEEALRIKTDSYVLETNVHFPTDLNLLWDSSRKCLDLVDKIRKKVPIAGWRKIKAIRQSIKSEFRSCSQKVFNGKNDKQKKESVRNYLGLTQGLSLRCHQVIAALEVNMMCREIEGLDLHLELQKYVEYLDKFNDLVRRRLLNNEVIPAHEKIYSIFEPHTEWITKGKLNKKVELGHSILITTDQTNLILDYHVMEEVKDVEVVGDWIRRIEEKFGSQTIASHSFDKGFSSRMNKEKLDSSNLGKSILPKKGKKNIEEKERESRKEYKKLRNKHSAIESNINMLEHHGLDRCPDKGLYSFKRYVGFGILAYNLHIIGNHLQELAKAKEKRRLAA